jgi:hypothetical protein
MEETVNTSLIPSRASTPRSTPMYSPDSPQSSSGVVLTSPPSSLVCCSPFVPFTSPVSMLHNLDGLDCGMRAVRVSEEGKGDEEGGEENRHHNTESEEVIDLCV